MCHDLKKVVEHWTISWMILKIEFDPICFYHSWWQLQPWWWGCSCKFNVLFYIFYIYIYQSFLFSTCDHTHTRLHTRKLNCTCFSSHTQRGVLQFSVNINFPCSHDCLYFSFVTWLAPLTTIWFIQFLEVMWTTTKSANYPVERKWWRFCRDWWHFFWRWRWWWFWK